MWFSVAEVSIGYDDGPVSLGIAVSSSAGGRIARESIYVAEGFAPPEWRASWRDAPCGALTG